AVLSRALINGEREVMSGRHSEQSCHRISFVQGDAPGIHRSIAVETDGKRLLFANRDLDSRRRPLARTHRDLNLLERERGRAEVGSAGSWDARSVSGGNALV